MVDINVQELHWGMDKTLPTGNYLIRVYEDNSPNSEVLYETRVSKINVESEVAYLEKKYGE